MPNELDVTSLKSCQGVRSTSAHRPAWVVPHEPPPLATLNSSAGTSSIGADANGHCLMPRKAHSLRGSKTELRSLA